MSTRDTETTEHTERASAVLASLGLRLGTGRTRPVSGHNGSILLPCRGADDRRFLLKFFIPPPDGRFYPLDGPPWWRFEDTAKDCPLPWMEKMPGQVCVPPEDPAPVPLPYSVALLGSALSLVAAWRVRR